MNAWSKGYGWLVLAVVSQEAVAKGTVQRCMNDRGQTTFTYAACPDGRLGETHRAWNPPPGSVLPMPMAPPADTARQTTPAPPLPKPAPAAKPAKPEPKAKARKKKPVKYVPWTGK